MTEKSIATALKDVRRALLDADVNLNVADASLKELKSAQLDKKLQKESRQINNLSKPCMMNYWI